MPSKTNPKTWVETHVVRLVQSSFQITSASGLVVAIDPFQASAAWTKPNLILITHSHPDHFNAKVVRSLLKEGTRVVVPASMKALGADKGLATHSLAPGETMSVGPLTITTVRAYNLESPFHRREKDWVGYLFELDGLTLYHAGDTDLVPEMETVRADVALLPAGGLFTMDAKTAALAAQRIGAKVAVPMHYGKVPFTGGAGRKFAEAFQGITVLSESKPSRSRK